MRDAVQLVLIHTKSAYPGKFSAEDYKAKMSYWDHALGRVCHRDTIATPLSSRVYPRHKRDPKASLRPLYRT